MQESRQHILIVSTCPDAATAESLAQKLVEETLAACVNVVSGVKSFYQWQGELNIDSEYLLIAKTEKSLVEEIEQTIQDFHPYELPEIIAVPIEAGTKPYLDWISSNIKSAQNNAI